MATHEDRGQEKRRVKKCWFKECLQDAECNDGYCNAHCEEFCNENCKCGWGRN